jgi:hypothetical protein
MIFAFEISSPENSDFKRVIHIKSDDTFEDLHRMIQDSSNFDQSQVASFFKTDDQWSKQVEIGLLTSGEKNSKILSMYNSILDEHISEIGEKLVYVFDFFNDRFFYVELKEKFMKTDLKEPFVAYEKDNAPSQFLTTDLESPDIEVVERDESYKSFGDLEDYYEIFGELDA